MPDAAFLDRHPAVLVPALAALAVGPGMEVLDVGCGRGDLTRALAARCPGSRWFGVDISTEAVAFANGVSCSGPPDSAVTFAGGDGTALPFPEARFHRTFCNLLLHLRTDRRRIVEEMARVTRPGGRVVCSDVDVGESALYDAADPGLGDALRAARATAARPTWRIGRALPDLLRAAGCVRVAAISGAVLLPGGPTLPVDIGERRSALFGELAEAEDAVRRHEPDTADGEGARRWAASLGRRLRAVEAGMQDPAWETVSTAGPVGSWVAWGERP